MEKTQKTFTTIEEEFLAWKKQFKKDYSTIKPTLEDAFRGGCMAIVATLPKPSFSKEDVDEILAHVDQTIGRLREGAGKGVPVEADADVLFEEDTHNCTLDEIATMRDEVASREAHLRQCIREAASRVLMDTSEDNPLVVDITLDVEGGPGMSCLEMPEISRIWQDPVEGIIWVTLDNDVTDFDDLRTDEQIQVLQALLNNDYQLYHHE